MGLFYAASPKELLQIRNKIFLDFGLPSLQKEGFKKSPFSTAWFGYHPGIGYSYELCRLSNGELEIINVQIVKGDLWIQIRLNIFKIQPDVDSPDRLSNVDGLQFHLPPNSLSNIRLKCDDIAGPPILNYQFWFRNHKLRGYFTKAGLSKRAEQLGRIIETDMSNIDSFVKRWHEMHQPITTSWTGIPVK